MSRQDKATTDRHARILRELVKQPDNKACADCKKNDARWASWNLGVFLCIRCSGIHRSMGTHISKVKSIDLDIWTPEQMENIQKWGNRRANVYWEKHLKAGHIPLDHKIESFIRSKYDSKRWAMNGPPPQDPSVLDGNGGAPAEAVRPTPTTSAPPAAPASLPRTHPLLSRATPAARAQPSAAPAAPAPILDLFAEDPPAPAPTTSAAPRTTAPPQPHTAQPGRSGAGPAPTLGAAVPGPTAAPVPATAPSNIFDLDFRGPSPAAKPQTAKADILSLYSSTPSSAAPSSTNSFFSPPQPLSPGGGQNQFASWSGGITSSAAPQSAPPTQTQNQVSISGWGMQADTNAWGASTQVQPRSQQQSVPAVTAASGGGAGLWGNSGGGGGMNGLGGIGADPWASTGSGGAGGAAFGAGGGGARKKDDKDPFANLWE